MEMEWFWWLPLLFMTIVSSFVTVEGEFPFHVRGHHSIEMHKRNVVNNREKAEELLQRYGYLRCNLWRKHRGKTKKKFARYCSKFEMKEAIRKYQRVFNIPLTGKLDKPTLNKMSASRCGNRDDEVGLQSMESTISTTIRKDRKGERRKSLIRHKRTVKADIIGPHSFLKENISENSWNRRLSWIQNQMNNLADIKSSKIIRQKRAAENEDHRDIFRQEVITWRLIVDGYSHQMTVEAQRMALALAFRMWSEVIPPMFLEDRTSPIDDVDILIAFGRGDHLSCLNNFDGMGGQISHAIRQSTKAEIHVDDDEYFTLDSTKGTNLLKVAVHEIGHVLGLIHTRKNHSIMYAIYSEMTPNKNFELNRDDRQLVQSIYGICEGKFNTVFDWVRRLHDGQFIYNTYFFRGDHYWMYENQFSRTRYGDPLDIATKWRGLNGSLDGFAHVQAPNQDIQLFFKGDKYWKYDNDEDKVSPHYPKLISEGFQAIPGTNNSSIPNSIDTVYFDVRDETLYFFKDNLVYGYDVSRGNKGCCLSGYPKPIKEKYPSNKVDSQLPSNLDVVYYSYTDRTLYFFKNTEYWVASTFFRHKRDWVDGPFPINRKWRDICDVLNV